MTRRSETFSGASEYPRRRGRHDHGSGGRAMAQLIEELFVKHFDNDLLRQANDQAAFDVPAGRMVMSTDGHVISPLFFPGGDIGSLSVHGTVNDVAMSGARPLYLSAGFILEEGFPLADLEKIVASMARGGARWPACPWSPATPRWWRRARATVSSSPPPGVGVVPAGVEYLRRSGAAGRCDAGQRQRSVITAWPSCPAARTWSSRPRSSLTRRRCTPWSRTWWRRCRTSTACATPPAADWRPR